jgi:hypothetical protein
MSDIEFSTFWETYPVDLCNRRGSKKKAELIYDKLDDDVKKRAIVNMRELMRVDRALKKAGEFVPKWPMVTTWLNGERWEDIADIRQSADMPKGDTRTCSTDGCNGPVEWKTICWRCYDKLVNPDYHKKMQELANENRRTGCDIRADETPHEWYLRCRRFCVERGYKGGNLGGSR